MPGRDLPWRASVLWDYLLFRSATCKPPTLNSELSALAYSSVRYGHILPVSKYEQPALLYKQIRRMRAQLKLDAVSAANGDRTVLDPEQCTPLDNNDVAFLFAAYGVYDRDSFLSSDRPVRHHLFANTVQYTAAMRFGHFIYRAYRVDDFVFRRDCWLLRTTWHRYPGRKVHVLRFPVAPEWECMFFEVPDTHGNVSVLTAASVIDWHFSTLEQSDLVFEPVVAEDVSRTQRQRWLRYSFMEAIHSPSPKVTAALRSITPHAFRSGIGGSLKREGASPKEIASVCRWASKRAAALYVTDRPPLSKIRASSEMVRLSPHRRSAIWRRAHASR